MVTSRWPGIIAALEFTASIIKLHGPLLCAPMVAGVIGRNVGFPPWRMQDVAAWLGPADARRARLVCRHWRASLNALSTRATTPPETGTVSRWKGCLNSLVCSLPALQEVTVGGRLSDVGMQQLSELRRASQLRQLTIADGQALRDKSLQVRPQGRGGRFVLQPQSPVGRCPKRRWHWWHCAWSADISPIGPIPPTPVRTPSPPVCR